MTCHKLSKCMIFLSFFQFYPICVGNDADKYAT